MKTIWLALALLLGVTSARAQVMGGAVSGTNGATIDPGNVIIISTTTTLTDPILSVQDNNGATIFAVLEDSAVVTGNASVPNGGASVVIKSTSAVAATPVLVVEDSSGNVLVSVAGEGGIKHFSRTTAQLQAIVPANVGESFYCSDCSPKKLLVSTGTAAGNFADAAGGQFR